MSEDVDRPAGDATALARAIAAGRTTAAAAMDAAIAAAEADRFGAIARLDPALGRADAAASDLMTGEAPPQDPTGTQAPPLPHAEAPFHGVPFLGKDLGGFARGLAPAAGSTALRKRVQDPPADGAVFARFRQAGLIPFGLTACPEFGLSLTTEPQDAPPCRNPWNPELSPGGSSGGAAAAVASGIVAIAHATDAAGSIRVPAAACGLYGLKPSRGATPMAPDFSNWLAGLVGEGVVARSLRDLGAAITAISGQAEGPVPDPTPCAMPATPRVALAVSALASPAAARACEEAAEALGEIVLRVPAEELDAAGLRAGAAARTILSASLAGWLSFLQVGDEEVSPLAAASAAEGRAMPATQLFAATQEMARVAHALHRILRQADVIVSPVLADGPPRVGALDFLSRDLDAHFDGMQRIAPNAALANVSGLPALAVPLGMEGGLPRSAQLMGRFGADRGLIALAARLPFAPPPFPPLAGLPA